jgi:hypothetical protein
VIKGLSDHQFYVFAYLFSAVAPVTVIRYWFSNSGGESALGGGQFEGEDELGDFLEVAAQAADLTDDVLQADDVSAQMLFHLSVGLDLHSLFADLGVQLLVDELTD